MTARAFPSARPFPSALFYADAGPLASFVDAVIYLGPDADRDLSNSLELSGPKRAEVARRDVLFKDGRRMLELRYGQRSVWFRAHPNDLPERPQGSQGW